MENQCQLDTDEGLEVHLVVTSCYHFGFQPFCHHSLNPSKPSKSDQCYFRLGTVYPEFPHSSATFNIILGSRILTSPEVLQGTLGDSTCPTQCSQPCPMPANRHLRDLTWFPIVLNYIK